MGQTLTADDMLFHMLVTGGTGSGKTNAVLHMLNLFYNKKEESKPQPALFLFDPGGDASIDLLRSIPESEWKDRVAILDPQYVSFGFNLLSLPEGLTLDEKAEVLQTQVEEFSILLSDVFNTDSSTAPRLMWIFKGALYYLYTFTDDPTFWDLYNIMLMFTKRSTNEIEDLLRRRDVQPEVIHETIEAISKLPQDAFMPVINRISNFVLPPSSITFRTFCARRSTFDLEKRMEPGMLTIFRIPSSLPNEFRRLFASAVVMKLYFASLKRARRLERAGEAPVARTPVILAADEFRDIAQLRILRTILSQSRKFGLYLWMVVQTLSEIPDDLLDSIQSNVGSILAFRGSPDDARKLAKLLYPQNTEAVESLIPGLEDYTAVVRKRPVGGKPMETPFRVTFPKLPLAAGYAEAMRFLREDMEKLYGGTVGDRNLIYKDELEKARKERGDCPLGGPLYWMPLAYLHRIGNEIAFSHMARIFEDRYGWDKNVLQIGLNFLADRGLVGERVEGGQLYMGIDPQTKQAMFKEPETEDEKMQARQVLYSITPSAQDEFFRFDYRKWRKNGRVGGPLHVRAMRRILEKFWEKGYWCAFDRGDREGPFPDILYIKPLVSYKPGKEGKLVARIDPDHWDEESRKALEIEITPGLNPQQLTNNWQKNVARYRKVTFVVVLRDQIPEIINTLQGKERTTFDVVWEDIGLPGDEIKNLVAEGDEPNDGGEDEPLIDNTPPSPDLHRNETRLLSLILSQGYRNKTVLAKDLGVDERTVTRYLVHLEKLGLISREKKRYILMQEGRKVAEGFKASDHSDDPDKQAKLG
ncbi:MAG: TraM recognition domain-containing protein [Nitrososphaerota archaeon]|jgi:DNA helicase HerA-like ATPase|nr:TraM recognition domain-containing protein [Nitrososphaerota archaeon]